MYKPKLIPPSPERQALVTEYARQVNSGEYQAGYWQWLENKQDFVYHHSAPALHINAEYHYEPSPRHPHYAIFCEWETHKNSGEVGKNWWCLLEKMGGGSAVLCANYPTAGDVPWIVSCDYEILKTDKHPDNIKPKLKLIDFANVPVGTMTDRGEILFIVPPAFATVRSKMRIDVVALSALSIIPAKKWTAVQDGEKPPVCDGLVIELRMAGGNTINAYRVIGLAEGWTDVPKEAV